MSSLEFGMAAAKLLLFIGLTLMGFYFVIVHLHVHTLEYFLSASDLPHWIISH